MKTEIQFIDCHNSEALKAHVREKLSRMESDFPFIESGKIWFKIKKEVAQKNKCTEIELRMHKKKVYAESKSEKFIQSCDLTLEKIRKQLEKIKTNSTP